MKYIGLIKTDDLPSTSIGLRVSEMAKLGFSPIILYAKTRTTVAKQFRNGTVVSDEKRLRDEVARHGDCIVVIAARHIVDANGVKALGEPKERECRCLTGQRLIGCMSGGSRSVIKVFEYDRRKGVARFDRGDSGDVRIDTPGDKGLMAIRSSGFLKMLEQGDSFIAAGNDFQETADAVGVSVTCVDPVSAGVNWHSGMIHDEKKPINVVYGEKTVETKKKNQPTMERPVNKTEYNLERIVDPPKESKSVKNAGANGLPILSIVFQTHNRTATACYCLNSICKNLKYDGELHYCICDDRSYEGHVAELVKVMRLNKVGSFSLHFTDDKRWGLGASINNGLIWSFKFTDVILTVEDDFLLKKEFDITGYVEELLKPNVGGIKLAANSITFNPIVKCEHAGFGKVVSSRKVNYLQRYTFNNLVMLRHKRVYDAVGLYLENVSPEIMETDAIFRFNKKFNDGFSSEMDLLWPLNLRVNTYNTEWFMHIGASTLGHTAGQETAKIYDWLAKLDKEIKENGIKGEETHPFFNIVIPCYNNPTLLDRCLGSIQGQSMVNSVQAIIVDDVSNASLAIDLARVVSKYDFAVFSPLHDKRMAGGARNHGLDHCLQKSEYTMFLDSDDELASSDVIQKIYEKLNASGFPDVLFLGYVSNGNQFIASKRKEGWAAAPWSRCTKTEKVQRFTENRRMCNDTMQYLKTIDAADSFERMDTISVKYNHDNPDSGWSNLSVQTTKEGMDSMAMTMSDILNTSFSKKSTRIEAVKSMSFISKKLENAISIKRKANDYLQ